jgi:amino acid transporter
VTLDHALALVESGRSGNWRGTVSPSAVAPTDAICADLLAVINCLLNTAGLRLEFLALIVLRVRRPDAPRSFRVPWGWLGMSYVCVAPFGAAVLLLPATFRDWRSYPGQILVVGGIVIAGIVLYFARRRRAKASDATT